MVATRKDAVGQPGQAGLERPENLIEGTESPLRFLAEVASADPGYFRTEQSRDLLYRALTSRAYRRHLRQLRGWLSSGRDPHRRGSPARRSSDSGGSELALQLHRCNHLCALTGPPSQILRHMAPSSRCL